VRDLARIPGSDVYRTSDKTLFIIVTILWLSASMTGGPAGWVLNDKFTIDPVDIVARAMCYHHLGQRQQLAELLHLTRELGSTPEQRFQLNEAETLIDGEVWP
jgi:hypothetical protein